MYQSLCDQLSLISIHALREEGDQTYKAAQKQQEQFLSTPSARRATVRHDRTYQQGLISIHALREEGDLPILANSRLRKKFLSTPSARRATQCNPCGPPAKGFLSTPSARRATLIVD